MMAAEIFADFFANDRVLRQQVIECFTQEPQSSTAAAALAELSLRGGASRLLELLGSKSGGLRYDIATHFKLMAALASSEDLLRGVATILDRELIDPDALFAAYWVPAVIRRIEMDEDAQAAMRAAVEGEVSMSAKVSYLAILARANAVNDRVRAFAVTERKRLDQQPIVPVGFDLTVGAHRPEVHVLHEVLTVGS
jgi:hypothetical protein